MASAKKKASATGKNDRGSIEEAPLTTLNYILFIAGLVVITAGWFLLRAGHVSISPILLVLGYCVMIPLGIIVRPGGGNKNS